jgi:hypothetical protein
VVIADLGLKPKNPTNSKKKKKNGGKYPPRGSNPPPLYPKLAG